MKDGRYMKKILITKSLIETVLVCTVAVIVIGTLIGCGKKKEEKNSSEAINKDIEETVNEETEDNDLADEISIDRLNGVWQLNADTPAGDPYVYQIEIKELGMMTFEGYSMQRNIYYLGGCEL